MPEATTKPAADPGAVPELTLHPLCKLMPEQSAEQFEELKADIKAHKLRLPVMLYNGQVLDGRGRHRGCKELWESERCDTGWKTETFQGTEKQAREYVISINVKRRHLSESQRAIIAAQLANGTHGGDRSKAPIGALTDKDAAKLLNVGETSVQRAKKVLNVPTLSDAVRNGEIKVSAAQKWTESDNQDELLKKHGGDIVKAVKEANQNTDTLATTLWKTLKSKFETVKKLDDLEATIKVLSDKLATYLKAQKELAEADKKAT
jgi:hypothetical protein